MTDKEWVELCNERHIKVIDFDSVVQNTKSSKSIILMSAFSNILLQSRSSEATNIGYRFSSRASVLNELNRNIVELLPVV